MPERDESTFACPNPNCSRYRQSGGTNIRPHSWWCRRIWRLNSAKSADDSGKKSNGTWRVSRRCVAWRGSEHFRRDFPIKRLTEATRAWVNSWRCALGRRNLRV